jgi:hypothetical protein
MGETTTLLESQIDAAPQRVAMVEILGGLVERGLMVRSWGTYGGPITDRRTGEVTHGVYEDDWWHTTDAGRAAIGVQRPAQAQSTGWLNPSSGPYRVPPVLAPWCRWRHRRGKPTVPAWYTRLTGTPAVKDPPAGR